MTYQGDANDIDPHSPTGRLVNNGKLNDKVDKMRAPTRDNSAVAARVMQELRINGEAQDKVSAQNSTSGHLQPDQSSSRLTDMLHGVSPHRDGRSDDFQPNCPSAVPSPLHRMPGASAPNHPMVPIFSPPGSSVAPPPPPKTLEDHFFMTNEHIDVNGKLIWDHIDDVERDSLRAANNRYNQMAATCKVHVDELKMHIDSLNEKADRSSEQTHNVKTKLDELFDYIKSDVMGIIATQDKKTSGLEQNVAELQKSMMKMQKTMEQRQSETKPSQQHSTAAHSPTLGCTTSPFPPPTHRSQPSLAGFYGNMTESGRESQPPVPHMADHRNGEHDPRAGYGTSYGGQQWAPRSGYQGRGSKEERPYSGANPYHFANGTPNSGQFGGGYNGGYATYG